MTARETYEKLVAYQKETAILASTMSLLGWDLRVYIPPKGVKHRSEQMAALTALLHRRHTDPRVGEWLSAIEASDLVKDPESVEAVNVDWWRWAYDRITRIPQELAVERSRVTTQAEKAWEMARENNDFRTFEPWLERIVRLTREIADCLGYEKEPYDALLDGYERGLRSEQIDAIFAPLRDRIPELVSAITAARRQPDTRILHRHYPVESQKAFIRKVLTRLGYDFEAGRLDPTVHPFATRIGPGDVRITTRYHEDFFNPAFFGSVHEAGHALYEQGLSPEHFGEPVGLSVSLGIHESQSRMWENFVARSPAFWDFFYTDAQSAFEGLRDVSREDFVFAINEVKPSTIRVEADEVTYNLHIILRYELEREMVRGNLKTPDLPGVWNETFRRFFGFVPVRDSEGVLQDVHWSGGQIGYFPTYTLGNIYAAQFFEAACRALGDLNAMFAHGEFAPLLNWLRENIHSRGSRYRPEILVQKVTGNLPGAGALIAHLERKFSTLYGL
ncbi:MAG: carboxypeptidase M32 [bacterium JZ-2024 1]